MEDHSILRSARFDEQYEELSQQLLRMKHQLETAEAKAAGLNGFVNEVWQFGLSSRTAFLGPVITTRAYDPEEGGVDSGQVIQAVLLVPGGLGVLVWDTEEFVKLSEIPDGLEAHAPLYHVPFERCEPMIRALLNGYIEPLVERLLEALKTSVAITDFSGNND